MMDPTRSPRMMKFLSLVDRGKAFLFRRERGRDKASRNLIAFYSRVWHEAAKEIGAEIEDFGHGAFEIRLDDFRTRVQNNCTAVDDLATHTFVRTKPVMYRVLEKEGLPIPQHAEFTIDDMSPGVAFLERMGKDCVVKPACGTGGGLGVATGIRTRYQLARSGWIACVHGQSAVIEEQLEGLNYRLLYLDGKLIDAVVRNPPNVIADGTSTVLQLVQKINENRVQQGSSHSLLTIDIDMQRTLAKQKLSLRSVVKKGTNILLKTGSNENNGSDNVTATDMLCESIIADGARAAACAGVNLAGVDILTKDPSVPLAENGGVFLEVNSPPGYYWHYQKRDQPFPVAIHVLHWLLKRHEAGKQSRSICYA